MYIKLNILLQLLLVLTSNISFAQSDDNSTFVVGPQLCSDNSTEGYTDIDALNNDMLANALNGISWEEYIICPDTEKNFGSLKSNNKTFIIPVHNALIKCGNYGLRKDTCIFNGSKHHVILYPDIETFYFVEFRGFTFTGNQDISIGAWANPTKSVVFTDCLWKNNAGSTIIDSYYSKDMKHLRRLTESDTIDDIYNNLLQVLDQKPKSDNIFKEGEVVNEFQSMNVAFSSSNFENNKQTIGIAFTIGGYLEFANAQFLNNEAGVASIEVSGGAKLIIHSKSKFYNNTNGISSAYVNYDSTIEVIDTTNLSNKNSGYKCNDIFKENSTSSCMTLGMYDDNDCFGLCCRFGNEVHSGKYKPLICR